MYVNTKTYMNAITSDEGGNHEFEGKWGDIRSSGGRKEKEEMSLNYLRNKQQEKEIKVQYNSWNIDCDPYLESNIKIQSSEINTPGTVILYIHSLYKILSSIFILNNSIALIAKTI